MLEDPEKKFSKSLFLSLQLKECLVFQVGAHFFELSTDLKKFLMGHSIGRVKRGYLGEVRCNLSVKLDFFYFYGLPLQPFLILVLSSRVLTVELALSLILKVFLTTVCQTAYKSKLSTYDRKIMNIFFMHKIKRLLHK
jgi:hypothetical protein